MQKIISIILSCFLFISVACNAVLSYRLEQNRQQLELTRVELERSRDNYKIIREGLGRTAEILCQSTNTVQDLRRQISEIRESYEAMADILTDNNGSCYK